MAQTFTLAQLLEDVTIDNVVSKILGVLQSNGSPITDWYEGGTERTRVKAFATALRDLAGVLVKKIAGGSFLDFADTVANSVGASWLRLHAEQVFDTTYNKRTRTVGKVRLNCAVTAGPHNLQPGALIIRFTATGNRYFSTNTGVVVIPSGGFVDVEVKAEFEQNTTADPPVNFSDPSGAAIELVSFFAGVTVTNPAPTYSPVTLTGTGTGTVTPSGTPSGSHSVSVKIETSGQAGAAGWRYSIDGGAYSSVQTGASLANLGGFGIDVTLANGAGTPSFVAGDVYTFTTPGTWITTQGLDDESNPNLIQRCRARWPEQGAIPSEDVYILMARRSSTQITQVFAANDPVVNNKILLYLAGAAGLLSAGVLASAQAYIRARTGDSDLVECLSPAERTITLSAALVRVKASKLVAAQAAAQSAIATYLQSVGTNGKVKRARIVDLVMSIDGIRPEGEGQQPVGTFTGLTISGANADGEDLQLPVTPGAFELPKWTQTLSTLWTWEGVP